MMKYGPVAFLTLLLCAVDFRTLGLRVFKICARPVPSLRRVSLSC
jgi:hypothetical protein